ncbi:Ku protein [Lysobacter ciconiae]|uniref:Non-homologous end joining protein Ku n=1 Tax=Novilysobacter ciconiae TaxID=2781022 RepID=A0A7S6UGC4_9GAMM|nr:Ku protein [Lysobacter ciconiae]QOW19776.1 Ku protein [Lysobacter ciconiae]
MARPIWTGTLSFGLLNIPASLMAGERRTDISLRMLDARDQTPIRYERVNAATGEEVAWKDIVKAFEYDKGSYVVLEPEDIRSAAPESHDAIEVESFIEASQIDPRYFEKPYVLVPAKKAEKGYVLLREALTATGRIGIARVVIRTRESLCAVIPHGQALLLLMMRFPQELVDIEEYRIPEGKPADYRITAKEQQISEQLIEAMSGDWNPEDYHDEFRQRLHDVIAKRVKDHKVVEHADEEPAVGDHAATNVVDFMSLLQKSIERKQRTPAQDKASGDAPAKASSAGRKKASSKSAGKPAKKDADEDKPVAAKAKKATTRKTAAKKAPAKAPARSAKDKSAETAKKSPAKRRNVA